MRQRGRWFKFYRVAYGKPHHGPLEPSWLVRVFGLTFVIRYCAKGPAW